MNHFSSIYANTKCLAFSSKLKLTTFYIFLMYFFWQFSLPFCKIPAAIFQIIIFRISNEPGIVPSSSAVRMNPELLLHM